MPQEGDIRIAKKTSQPEYGGSYGEYKVKEIYLACPRCLAERWVNVNSVLRLGFTGLCPKCLEEVIDAAFKPYRSPVRLIYLRDKVKQSRIRRPHGS